MLHMPGKLGIRVRGARRRPDATVSAPRFQLGEFSKEEIARDPPARSLAAAARGATRATASRASRRRSRSAGSCSSSRAFPAPGRCCARPATCRFAPSRTRGRAPSACSRSSATRPSLLDVGLYRWYGWDGAHDSLWSQSIRPLLDAREMRSSAPKCRAGQRQLFAKDYEARSAASCRQTTKACSSTLAKRSPLSRKRWSPGGRRSTISATALEKRDSIGLSGGGAARA